MTTNLYKIGQWYKHHGLVGEEKLAIVQTVVAVAGKPIGFGLIASSGSGKTATMDLLVGDPNSNNECLIDKSSVYFKDAASATAQWYEADKIKTAKLFVLKELQKDKSHDAVEMIKSMTEGKSARRKVTNMAQGTVDEQIIKAMPVLFTYAVENNSANPDAELQRRCITMNTDISKQQTSKVLQIKAKLRWDRDASKVLSDEEAESIKNDVNSIFTLNSKVLNPFAEEFAKMVANVAPDQKVRSMMEHFWDVMDGVVKINSSSEPIMANVNGEIYLLASIQDLFQTLDVYKESFLRDVYSIPPMGDIILQGYNDATQVEQTKKMPKEMKGNTNLADYGVDLDQDCSWFEIQHVKKAIKEKQNIILSTKVVRDISYQLVDAGYLEIDKSEKIPMFKVVDKIKDFGIPDANKLLDIASKMVKDKFPDKFEVWMEKQKKPYEHPITGEYIYLYEHPLDEFEEDIM